MKRVTVITDGSCLGNPGRGGWAAILRYGARKKEITGGEPQTTNNRMELTAAIEALAALKETCEVEVVTDSKYVKNGIEQWMKNWKRNGWKTAAKKPVMNQIFGSGSTPRWRGPDQMGLDQGHANHEDNNRCDELAREAASRQK